MALNLLRDGVKRFAFADRDVQWIDHLNTRHTMLTRRMPSPIKPFRTSPSEPVGIVISDGGPSEIVPRFAAFVWGPVPDDDVVPQRELTLVGA